MRYIKSMKEFEFVQCISFRKHCETRILFAREGIQHFPNLSCKIWDAAIQGENFYKFYLHFCINFLNKLFSHCMSDNNEGDISKRVKRWNTPLY